MKYVQDKKRQEMKDRRRFKKELQRLDEEEAAALRKKSE